jgi:hypothetical protein
MRSKIGRSVRHPAPFQIARRPARDPVEFEPRQTNVPRQAIELPAADREIKSDFCKIDQRVTGPQIENDVGMPFDECW